MVTMSCQVFFSFRSFGVSVVMAFPVCQERMQLHEHLVEQGIAGQGNPNFFLGGELWLGSYPPGN